MVGVIVPAESPPPTGTNVGVPTQPAPAVDTVQPVSAPVVTVRVRTGRVVQPAPDVIIAAGTETGTTGPPLTKIFGALVMVCAERMTTPPPPEEPAPVLFAAGGVP